MAEVDTEAPSVSVEPLVVVYHSVTGVPEEYNEYLPKECEEFKRWKAAKQGPEALAALTLKDSQGNEIEKQLPGGKVKKKAKPQIVLEQNTRNKKKSITSVTGLDTFGVKLSDASKLFGKKFATGASHAARGSEQLCPLVGCSFQQVQRARAALRPCCVCSVATAASGACMGVDPMMPAACAHLTPIHTYISIYAL